MNQMNQDFLVRLKFLLTEVNLTIIKRRHLLCDLTLTQNSRLDPPFPSYLGYHHVKSLCLIIHYPMDDKIFFCTKTKEKYNDL